MSKKLSKFRVFLLLLLGAILLSGCAGSDVEEQVEPTVESQSFPTGTFFRQIGAGYTEFEFFDDGTYTWGFRKGTPAVRGEYDVDGQTLTFLSETVLLETFPESCGDIEGSYSWALEDKVLLIELDTDDCEERAEEHDGKEYVLNEE
jgi:hypothetical protein